MENTVMPRHRDLTGQTFGKLTVTERTDRTEDHYAVWRCSCACGKEAYVNTKRLLRGTIVSCGCEAREKKKCGARAEDITGQRFGRLTAIRQVESIKGKTCWLCKCDCGREKEIRTFYLRSGRVRSCGCCGD